MRWTLRIGILLLGALAFSTGSARATSNDALEAAIDALMTSVGSTSTCEAPPTPACEPSVRAALKLLERAHGDLEASVPPLREAQRADRALAKAAAAVRLLERARLGDGQIGADIAGLLLAAFERVDDAEDEAEEEIDSLCSGQRLIGERRLAAPQRQLDQATGPLTSSAVKLQRLRSALRGFDAAYRTAERSQTRCRPRSCPAGTPGTFTAGAPGNDFIDLIAADRGTLLDYDAVAGELAGFGASGVLRVTHKSLTSLVFKSELSWDLEDLGPGFAVAAVVSGNMNVRACLDEHGWSRFSSLSQRLRVGFPGFRGGATISAAVLAKPPAPFLISTLFPVPPAALRLRVGDRLEQEGVALTLRLAGRVLGSGGSGVVKAVCDVTHEVAAIEEVLVGSESLPTARIETSTTCTDSETGEAETNTVTTWVASRIGQVRVLIPGEVDLSLRCYEEPGRTDDRCGPF